MNGSSMAAASIIQKELGACESLVWSGRPIQGIRMQGGDIFMIPFSLLWGGFAIFWEYSAIKHGAPFFFALFGVPFVLVGLYIIVGRFFYDAKRRENTFYGLTNQRVIIISGVFSRNAKSLNLKTLSDISLTQKAGGYGTISLGSQPFGFPFTSWGMSSWPGMPVAPSFEMIKDAKSVYDMIRKVQQEA